MDAVAHQAGMSKKTIYRQFKSQVELLAALLIENVADMGSFTPPWPGRRYRTRTLRRAGPDDDALHLAPLHGAGPADHLGSPPLPGTDDRVEAQGLPA
jgi:AcrR family transcriptional regulator